MRDRLINQLIANNQRLQKQNDCLIQKLEQRDPLYLFQIIESIFNDYDKILTPDSISLKRVTKGRPDPIDIKIDQIVLVQTEGKLKYFFVKRAGVRALERITINHRAGDNLNKTWRALDPRNLFFVKIGRASLINRAFFKVEAKNIIPKEDIHIPKPQLYKMKFKRDHVEAFKAQEADFTRILELKNIAHSKLPQFTPNP